MNEKNFHPFMKKENNLQIIKILKIPKDLSTRENKFYTSMPKLFVGRVDANVWEKKITELNKIMNDGDSWSLMSIIRILIPFFALFSGFSYKKKVQKYINKWNTELAEVGIKIMDVTEYGYSEMEIILYRERN